MIAAEEWSALILSLKVAAWSIAIMLLPAIACAWLLARTSFRAKMLVDAIINLPLVLPPVVVGYLLLLLLGRGGTIGSWLHDTFGFDLAFTWRAAAIAAAVMGFPLMVRATRLAMELVDPRIEQAARTLGAAPLRVFATITLPLALPGLLAGTVLAFARSLGEFGATITFAGNIDGQTRTLPLAIYTFAQSPGGDGPVLRLIVISVTLSVAALVGSELLASRLRRRTGAPA